jgi:serine/threonine-protein kinase
VKVFDVGTLDNGTPYMVMEYLDGEDVEFAPANGVDRSPSTKRVELTLQACEVLSEAHALGIIHRDLKPRQLVLRPRPDVAARSRCSTSEFPR